MAAKKRETLLAEAAIKAVINQETEVLRQEMKAKDRRIAELESMLRQVVEIITRSLPGHPPLPPVQAKPLPPAFVAAEPDIPQGPQTELAEEDDLGEGRWA